MAVGAVVVGYRRECTRILTREQLCQLGKFKGKIIGRDISSKAWCFNKGIHKIVPNV